jgi:hypothetical protein
MPRVMNAFCLARDEISHRRSRSTSVYLFFPLGCRPTLLAQPCIFSPNNAAHAGHLQDGKLEDALVGFQKVLEMQSDSKGEWGFKALKQMVKALFRQNRYTEMMQRYQVRQRQSS